MASADLLRTDDDLADLIACLLHAGAREAKFRVDLPRDIDDATTDARVVESVLAGTRVLEKFTLTKK